MQTRDLTSCQWCSGLFPRKELVAHMRLVHPAEFERKQVGANRAMGMDHTIPAMSNEEPEAQGLPRIEPKAPAQRKTNFIHPALRPARSFDWNLEVHLLQVEKTPNKVVVHFLGIEWFHFANAMNDLLEKLLGGGRVP